MPIKRPSHGELRSVAQRLNLTLSENDVETFRDLMGAATGAVPAGLRDAAECG